MIRSLVAHVRGWSFLVKFVIVMTAVFFTLDLFSGKGFSNAFENVLFGATMLVGGGFLAPVVVAALFSALHERVGVESSCGNPERPTENDWHSVVISLTVAYAFVAVSLAVMGQNFSLLPVLWATVAFMAPWLGLILLIATVMEAVHFLGHYREHRREQFAQEQAREQARRDKENSVTDRTFWEMVRGHKPDAGSVS